ncbi:MAG: heavy-metal-associated domain-containing protein [Ignavibacteria bacterium]|nr:heavy-metal-associated domain-containing protein [Ignavibacteria bacterium]
MLKTTIIILSFFITAGIYSNAGMPLKIKTVVINTYGMHCTGCEETIETEIKKLDGVKSVKADHVNKKVTVKYESTKTNPNSIKEAIKSAGYRLEE